MNYCQERTLIHSVTNGLRISCESAAALCPRDAAGAETDMPSLGVAEGPTPRTGLASFQASNHS